MARTRLLRKFLAQYAYTAPRIAFALTAGLAARRNRQLLWRIGDLLGFTECPPTLPRVDAARIVDETLPIVLRETDAADGNVTVRELVFLAQLVRSRSPRRIFEIGTFDGRTTLTFAANSPDGAIVNTLDLPNSMASAFELAPHERKYVDKPASGARVHGTELAGKVRQLLGDSATFDFTRYPSDFVFVDGSHAYEYVVSDSHRARAMIGDGPGTIVWHDYGEWADVTRALNELQRADPAFSGLAHVAGTSLAILSV